MPTADERAEIYRLRQKLEEAGETSWESIAEKYPHIPRNQLRKIYTRERRKRQDEPEYSHPKEFHNIGEDEEPPTNSTEQIKFKVDGNTAYAACSSEHIRSLDDLLSVCNTDMDKWRVTRWVSNVWITGKKHKIVDLTWTNGVMDGYVSDDGTWNQAQNWQVKAWFEPREEWPMEAALEGLIERVGEHAPRYDRPAPAVPDGDYLLVPNIYDAHIGKRSYDGSYTVQSAAENFVRAAEAIAGRALSSGNGISQVMFPVGHDMLHADNLFDTTTRGTWVEMSVDLRDAIDAACWALPKAIEIFSTIAPVDVIPVESNHDRVQVHWIGRYLDAYFRHYPHISVRTKRAERQYYQWGRVGIGMTHQASKVEALANIFPIEARYMWPEIEWTEWLTGHMHKERGALYAVESMRGTVVKTIPAMCDLDNYHMLHLYVGSHRAAEGMLYSKTDGPADRYPVFISQLN